MLAENQAKISSFLQESEDLMLAAGQVEPKQGTWVAELDSSQVI